MLCQKYVRKSFTLPLIIMALCLSIRCFDFAEAQPVTPPAGNKAVTNFKPMVNTGVAPQVGAQLPLPPGETPFPKLLTPYPNVGAQQTPGQAQTILNNVQQIPPRQMVPNKKEPFTLPPIPGLNSGLGGNGNGGAPYPNGGDLSDDGSIRYPGTSSDDGDTRYSDRPSIGRTGDRCAPEVKSEYASQFSRVRINDSIQKLAGAHCGMNEQPTDPLICMACNLYFEVDPSDSYQGYVAVARSVMTRAMSEPYPRTVCKVVYQHTPRVAQYSWTFESPSWNPNHILPTDVGSKRMQYVYAAVKEAFEKGPNGYTNYYAQKLVNPKWSSDGSCSATLCTIEHHTFCAISAKQNRSFESYLQQETALAAKVSPVSAGNVSGPGDASK